jgi:hypothetical protein
MSNTSALPLTSPPIEGGPSSILGGLDLEFKVEGPEESGREHGDGRQMEETDREFEGLVKDLREAMGDLSGKGKVWLPESERRNFRIMLVDKVSLLCLLRDLQLPQSG